MAKKDAKLEITEFKPEPGQLPPTREEQQWEVYKKQMQMFAASCDREIQRIAFEHGVRIGDSVIHEKSLCDEITQILTSHRDNYLEAINP